MASLISIRIGLSVALVEIGVRVLGGNFLGLHTTPWIDFLASFGSVLLTFLAGAEVDPVSFRRHLKPSLAIGAVSFLFPFLGPMAFAYYVAGSDLRAAQIGGIALSTTSVAVVYAVMVETGLNETDLGKLIVAACFVTDLGTVVALGLLFASSTCGCWFLWRSRHSCCGSFSGLLDSFWQRGEARSANRRSSSSFSSSAGWRIWPTARPSCRPT